MYVIPPILIVALAALVGAIWLVYRFRKHALSPVLGAVLGVSAGVVGALMFMWPLNFCTFERERDQMDLAIGLVLIFVGTVLCLTAASNLARRVLRRERTPDSDETHPGAFQGASAKVTAAVLLLPTLVVLALFLYLPMFETFRLSTQLARLGAPRTRFICVTHFTRLFSDTNYIQSAVVSLGMAAATVFLAISLSLLIATMAYRPIRGGRIYRTLLVWPYALSPVVAGIIFKLLFNPAAGVLNHYLQLIFGFQVPWLLDRTIAPWIVILAGTWNIMGFCILVYIAALQNVPAELEEAAAIDGANAFQRFFRITFPLLSPYTFFLLVTTTTYAFFDTFGLIDNLTRGGPLKSTSTLMYQVYVVGVEGRDLGRAAAQSLVLFLFVVGLTLFQFRASRGRIVYGA